MEFNVALICMLFTALAACYGWGMRGAVIGGEKGAMLPGAFIGLILAWFSGGAIRENFWIPAAVGLMGMTFGGTEPYGETIGFVLHKGEADYNRKKGYIGLAFKGALWFSVCGGFLGISFASMAGEYKALELILLCLLIPVITAVGYKVFNMPYDKQKKVYPKIFFSLTRREEWGSNVALLLALIVSAAIKKDVLSIVMMLFGFVFGAIGWCLAIRGYELAALPLRNGRYLLGKLFHNGIIDGWKLMEYVLGAFGGFGLSLAFCIRYNDIKRYNAMIEANGRFGIGDYAKYLPVVAVACVAVVIAINIYQFICDKNGKKLNGFLWDRIERPFYYAIPMIPVLLGSITAAKIMSIFMLVFVCTAKCVFDRFVDSKLLVFGQIISLAFCAATLAGCFTDIYSPFILVVAGIVPYMIAEFVWALWDNAQKGKPFSFMLKHSAFATVYPCFAVQSVAVLLVAHKIFDF